MVPLINKYSTHIKEEFGERVQKITVDAGFTCPNRDGSLAVGGCTFCNNDKFNPGKEVLGDTLEAQLDYQISKAKHRYKNIDKYFVYFRAYSNTYAPLEKLKYLYEKASLIPVSLGLLSGQGRTVSMRRKSPILKIRQKLSHHHRVRT